jgi:hypothetical protein
MAIFGIGETTLSTLDPTTGDRQSFAGPFSQVSLEGEAENVKAQGWIGGKLQTTSSAITSETWTLTLTFQETDRRALELAFGEIAETIPSITVPRTAIGVVPTAAPYEIAVPGIATGAEVRVVTSGIDAVQVPTADVTLDSNKVTLTADYAGKGVSVHYYQTLAGATAIGVADDPKLLNELSFSAKLYGPQFPKGILLVVPKINRISLPSYTTGDVSEWEVQFEAAAPPGERSVYQLIELPA